MEVETTASCSRVKRRHGGGIRGCSGEEAHNGISFSPEAASKWRSVLAQIVMYDLTARKTVDEVSVAGGVRYVAGFSET